MEAATGDGGSPASEQTDPGARRTSRQRAARPRRNRCRDDPPGDRQVTVRSARIDPRWRRCEPRRGNKPKEGTGPPSAARRVVDLDSSVEQDPGVDRGGAAMRRPERWGRRRHRHGTRRGRVRVGGSIAMRASWRARGAPCRCRLRAAIGVHAGFGFVLDSAGRWSPCGAGPDEEPAGTPGVRVTVRQRTGSRTWTGGVATSVSRVTGGGAEQRPSRLERAGNRCGWSRDRAGAGGNPGADPNGTTIHRTCAGQPVQSEERQEGSRPQRCGTAADEEEAFVGRSADGNPAHDPTFPQGLERSMRGQRGEPQIRNRLQHAGTAYRRNPSRW